MRIVCCWSFEEQRKRVGDRNACDECASAEVSESVDEWMNERYNQYLYAEVLLIKNSFFKMHSHTYEYKYTYMYIFVCIFMKICVYSQWSLHKLYVCTTLGNNKTNKKNTKKYRCTIETGQNFDNRIYREEDLVSILVKFTLILLLK